jgi:hypothetical protein
MKTVNKEAAVTPVPQIIDAEASIAAKGSCK